MTVKKWFFVAIALTLMSMPLAADELLWTDLGPDIWPQIWNQSGVTLAGNNSWTGTNTYQCATATNDCVTVQSTDDNATKYQLRFNNSAGTQIAGVLGTGKVYFASGLVTAPGLAPFGDTSSGFYQNGGIGVTVTGAQVANFGNTGIVATASTLTTGTMTATNSALVRCVINRYDWTNAMVVALGAVTAGDISVVTLPAKVAVKNAYVVIDTPDTSANALTIAVGRTAAAYIDFIVASDAKAAANTVYGDASGERGTNLTGYDLPSITGTTAINAHFIKTTSNLSTVLGSTGHVYLETCTLP